MEATILFQPLLLAIVVLAFLAAHRRRRRRSRPPVVVVGDADAAKRLIVDNAGYFSDHPILPLGIDLDAGHPKTTSITSAPYGPHWHALRRNLTASVLHRSRLHAQLHRDAADTLVASISSAAAAAAADDGIVVVRDALYAAVFTAAARLCLGDGVGEVQIRSMKRLLRDVFHSDVNALVLLTSARARLMHRRKWREFLGLRRRLGEVFGPVVAARRLSRRSNASDIECYLDSLLDVHVPEDIDGSGDENGRRRVLRDDEIVKLMWEFLGSSTEPVVACVEWTLARLVASPEVQSKLHRELAAAGDHWDMPPYLRGVVLESLRLHPPQPVLVRDVGAEGAKVFGIAPPPDGVVRFLFDVEKVGRDPKVWTDPEEFRPERFLAGGEGEGMGPLPAGHNKKDTKMMPFGAGRRHCPGVGMSVAQVGGFVATLVREFEWAPAPPEGDGVDLTAVTALFVKVMASPLRARVTPRMSHS